MFCISKVGLHCVKGGLLDSIFPSGTLSEVDYLIRFIVVFLSIIIFYLTKKNLVYPTLLSAIILSLFSSYL